MFTPKSTIFYTPASTKLKEGYSGVTLSVCLSVCGQNRVHSVSSTILIGSISYLHILSSNFRRCVVCNVCFENLKFWQILEICNFDFVFFWLGIQYDLIGWVIMRQWGVSSERRCSSCSRYETALEYYLNESGLWMLMTWCFSTKASAATILLVS